MQFADIICTSGDCSAGEANVQQMVATYNQLSQPSNFSASVNSIQATLSQIDPIIQTFSADCCAVRDLGVQAASITSQMLAAAGQVAPNVPAPPGSPFDFFVTVVEAAGVIALVGGVAWAGFALYKYAQDQPITIRQRGLQGRRLRR